MDNHKPMDKWRFLAMVVGYWNIVMFLPFFIVSLTYVAAGYGLHVMMFWFVWLCIMAALGGYAFQDEVQAS